MVETTEVLWITEVIDLIEKGKKQHKNFLKIKTRQVERGYERRVIVFQRTDLQTVENWLNHMKYSFKYETGTEPIPAEQSMYGGDTLITTTLVIKL